MHLVDWHYFWEQKLNFLAAHNEQPFLQKLTKQPLPQARMFSCESYKHAKKKKKASPTGTLGFQLFQNSDIRLAQQVKHFHFGRSAPSTFHFGHFLSLDFLSISRAATLSRDGLDTWRDFFMWQFYPLQALWNEEKDAADVVAYTGQYPFCWPYCLVLMETEDHNICRAKGISSESTETNPSVHTCNILLV